RVPRMRAIECEGLAVRLLAAAAEGGRGEGEEEIPYRRELIQGRTRAELLLLVTVGPLVVTGRIDDGILEMVEERKNGEVPRRVCVLRQRQQTGASARHAAGVDVTDVQHKAHG